MDKIRIGYVFLFCCLVELLNAQPIIEINDAKRFQGIGTSVNIFVDKSGALSIKQILKPEYQAEFKHTNQSIPNIGITDAVLWCQLKVKNATNEICYLDLFDAPPDSFAVYELISRDSVKSQYGGNYVSFTNREIQVNNYIFGLFGKTDSVKTLYVRVRHSRGTQLPLFIGTIKGILEYQHKNDFLQGIYFGVMLLMVLYNLSIFISLKDPSYIYYVFYGTCMILLNGVLSGYAFEYLWPNQVVLNRLEDVITASLGISGILFAMNFLHTKQSFPGMHKVFIGFLVIFAACVLLVLTQQFLLGTLIAEITSFVLIICFFITAFYLLKKGYKPAKFFLYAWTILLIGACIYILKDFDVIPYNAFTVYSLQMGSAIEAILLSLALADKINFSKKEKAEIQQFHQTELFNNQLEIKRQTMELIGREIHDNIGQKLTLAAIYAQRMEFDNIYPDLLPQLKGVSKIINDSLADLQELSRSLVDSKLERNSLPELLQIECERINATKICKIFVETGNNALPMNIVVKSFLLRTIQEFLQNSLKHSGCKQISIKMTDDKKGLYVTVSDDGKGFDMDSLKSQGIGLQNMERRIKVIGGMFDFKSVNGKGTIMNLFIPMELLNQSTA